MGSSSYLSNLEDEELNNYFSALGYTVLIVDSYKCDNLEELIIKMQDALKNSTKIKSPLIIFKSPKGFTIGNISGYKIENSISSHKNPLIDISDLDKKVEILKIMLSKYDQEIFDNNGYLKEEFLIYFKKRRKKRYKSDIIIPKIDNKPQQFNIEYAEKFIVDFIKANETLVFSPDEIYSNKMKKVGILNCFELLNENVLQALLQGYVQAENPGLFIGYEGFMPIVSSMIAQYYKYLLQKNMIQFSKSKPSLNYLLTSICWENTYSHQNPGFINELLIKDDKYYTVLYPKDGNNLLKCLTESLSKRDMINIITISKRNNKQYQSYEDANIRIDLIHDCDNPELVLCATGDYMLERAIEVSSKFKKNIRIIYITNPKILDINSQHSLSDEEFNMYFDNLPVIYLFSGYPNIIKSLLYERTTNFKVLGYNDQITTFGGVEENLIANGLSIDSIIKECNTCLEKHKKRIKIKGV